MASHAQTVRNPGPFQVSGGIKGLFGVLAVVGFAAFALGLSQDPGRAWYSFVQNHYYFMSIAVIALFWSAIQWATGAMWSAPVRRLSEAFTSYLPVALLSFVALYFGMKHIYIWTHPDHVIGDPVMEGKAGYLNVNFFFIRNLVAFGIWIFFCKKIIGNSVAQDANKDYQYSVKNRFLAPIFLIFFALSFTMMAYDTMMSLDPHWFSTMFGVYCFAGGFYAMLALQTLVTLYLLKKGALKDIVNDNHLHDLGKFMFAFTVFYGYIGFCQFMLIWYANMPEETLYFLHRWTGGWKYVSIFLFAKFFIPFFLLLPRDAKRNPKRLAGVAVFMLVAQWIDLLWISQPQNSPNGPQIGLTEIGTALGFLGVFGLLVSRFLGKHNIVAIGDPRLEESVFHHHQ